MGLLTPLYLAGLAALSLPVVLHLIRRTPRGRQVFSSLMFLTPSPPRLTRRSRLDHLLLLLLRLAALGLLAFAFARPFLRESALLPFDGLVSRRVAIVLDTSASMRRGDLWQRAVRKVEEVISGLGPNDDVALIGFDDAVHRLVEFDEEEQVGRLQHKAELVRERLRALAPSWAGSDLGGALVGVAGELEAHNDAEKSQSEPQIVVISDVQRGCRTDALQSYRWPEKLPVVVFTIAPPRETNATVQLLVDDEQAESDEPRVRVGNAANSAGEEFRVAWAGGTSAADETTAVATYVPAGQSRVVRLPRPAGNVAAERLVLTGDDADFDNSYYVVPPRPQHVRLVYIGDDDGSANGLRYYLELALADDPLRKAELQAWRADAGSPLPLDEPRPKLIVVSGALSPSLAERLSGYLQQGGTLLLVPADAAAAATLPQMLTDVELNADAPRAEGQYLMLGEIDFTHPLFAVFANPRYSDFTKIHFWKHRPVSVRESAETRVVARFDNHDPAILERTVARGRVFAFTSGWNPDDSQLALSSKFVPLVQAILDLACGGRLEAASITVGQAVPLPQAPGARFTIRKPDDTLVELPEDARVFPGADQPGVYRAQFGGEEWSFAANLARAESDTALMDIEQLEQLGVRLGPQLTSAERSERLRQQRDTELESRQKVWRWLIVAVLGVLIVETWLAGRAARRIVESTETGR